MTFHHRCRQVAVRAFIRHAIGISVTASDVARPSTREWFKNAVGVDTLIDKLDRAIAHYKIAPAGMVASKAHVIIRIIAWLRIFRIRAARRVQRPKDILRGINVSI